MRVLLVAAALVALAGCAYTDGAMNTNTQGGTGTTAATLTNDQREAGVSKLNDITGMLLDSKKLYADAAKLAKDSEFKAALASLSSERGEQAQNFQAHVRDMSGDPRATGGAAGPWQDLLMNVASLGQNDTKAAVGQVLKAENGLVEKLDQAIGDPALGESTKNFLRGARDNVVADRDRVADLKAKIDART